jgi:hypothetical protein
MEVDGSRVLLAIRGKFSEDVPASGKYSSEADTT